MSFVRAAFAFALLTPVIGVVGSRYIVTAMLARSPQPAIAPEAADANGRATASATVSATAAPTAHPTRAPATARPTASPTKLPLTPTIVLVMGTPTLALQTAAPAPTSAATRTASKRSKHAPATAAPRATSVPTPRATPHPTARPSAVPTPGIVVLARYWVSDAVARAGSTIGIGYVIDNSTGHTQHVMLGASIKSGRAGSWLASISDPNHDVVATVPPGISTHVRYFSLSTRLKPGAYDVAWGLRDAATGRRDAIVAAPSALVVHR